MTTFARTPLSSKESMKNRATSYLTPMAAKTMTKGSSEVRIFDWRMIWAASRLCGRPLPEKMGSF